MILVNDDIKKEIEGKKVWKLIKTSNKMMDRISWLKEAELVLDVGYFPYEGGFNVLNAIPYKNKDHGGVALSTSPIEEINISEKFLSVKTQNSVYEFQYIRDLDTEPYRKYMYI